VEPYQPQHATGQATFAFFFLPSPSRPFFLQRLFVFFFATHAQSRVAFFANQEASSSSQEQHASAHAASASFFLHRAAGFLATQPQSLFDFL